MTLAKALATGDMLCGGRLTVGIGVGGRHEDYRAVGADPATQTMRDMAERVAVMKRVWAGDKITDSLPVGPSPVQSGGPPLLVGSIGPKTIRSAAAWADGLAGATLYMNWIPAEYVDAMAPMTGWAGNENELLAVLRKFEEIGTEEIQLIPTSSDVGQLRRTADVVGQL
jgi:alkanesulfonate monooxygenase SsuD/methylene tetrahydromethanopterin reductase-like flavin-dependent oxidoreductase (luciferase family)